MKPANISLQSISRCRCAICHHHHDCTPTTTTMSRAIFILSAGSDPRRPSHHGGVGRTTNCRPAAARSGASDKLPPMARQSPANRPQITQDAPIARKAYAGPRRKAGTQGGDRGRVPHTTGRTARRSARQSAESAGIRRHPAYSVIHIDRRGIMLLKIIYMRIDFY